MLHLSKMFWSDPGRLPLLAMKVLLACKLPISRILRWKRRWSIFYDTCFRVDPVLFSYWIQDRREEKWDSGGGQYLIPPHLPSEDKDKNKESTTFSPSVISKTETSVKGRKSCLSIAFWYTNIKSVKKNISEFSWKSGKTPTQTLNLILIKSLGKLDNVNSQLSRRKRT